MGANTASPGPSAPASEDRTLIVPDLAGKTIDQATAALRAAGFQFEHLEPNDFICGYSDDRLMVKQGTVCGQEPMAGAERLPRLVAVRVTIEHDTYEHGGVGSAAEWWRMPDVVGKPIDLARTLLARASLSVDGHFEVVESDADGCASGEVCATEPKARSRKVGARKGRIYVGPVKPSEITPTQPTTGDTFF